MQFDTPDGPLDFSPTRVIVAGWTGRDAAGVQHHIDELAALGVAPPSQVPLYYRVAADTLTQADKIQVLGTESSGEVEPLIIQHDGEWWLGLASDHTDRQFEATSVAHSKQVCAKPVARSLWRLKDVVDRLDDLELASWLYEDGGWVAYQTGTLAAIRSLPELITGAVMQDGDAMLCGTLPAIGGVRGGPAFRMTLRDPVGGAEITRAYTVESLPIVS